MLVEEIQQGGMRHKTLWICDKWSDEAVEFVIRKLKKLDITHVPVNHGVESMKFMPIRHGISSALLRSLVGPPEECCEVAGNLLLNEGIAQLEDLTMIATVLTNQTAANCWGNTNAYLGVGTSSTAPAATDTDLNGTADTSNRYYKVMNATYPQRSGQQVTFVADFLTGEANFAWNEWTIAAGATTTSGTKNLNHKAGAGLLGTKASGTWTLTAQLTLS